MKEEELKFPLLEADDIEVRVGSFKEGKGLTLLLYKTARTDANILDKVVGQFNWQKKFYALKDTIYCSLGIRVERQTTLIDGSIHSDFEWVWKDDAGKETEFEGEKGEASDSFKRAGFAWGIGRELYTAPFIYIKNEQGIYTKLDRFDLADVGYDANKKISRLKIKDKNGVIVYSLGSSQKVDVKPSPKEEPIEKPVEQPIEVHTNDYDHLLDATLMACSQYGVDIQKVALYLKKPASALTDEDVMACVEKKKERMLK